MKILAVLPRFPYPLEKGDKLRAYHQLRLLAREHDVYLFCTSHHKPAANHLDEVRRFCKEVQVVRRGKLQSLAGAVYSFLKGGSLQLGYWNSRRIRSSFATFEQRVQPDVIYCQMVRTMPLVARLPFLKVMDFQDALSLNSERRMEQTTGFWRYVLHYEFKMLRSSEYNAFSIFDALTIISEVDSEAIPHRKNGEIHIITNGVDTNFFSRTPVIPVQLPDNPSFTICFCGNMSYAPNVDAACWLVKEIMPLVWRRNPYGVNVLIAGADPKPAVKALAGNKVTVSGRLDDIRAAYASARMFVAPMRIGSGMQNKLLEAMSMGLPCVTTTIAATPLGAVPWQHLLVGDSADEIADRIAKLTIEETHDAIADGGQRFVRERFSWHAAVKPLENILYGQLESK